MDDILEINMGKIQGRKMDSFLKQYYEEFVGLPNLNVIVRNGQIEDAFSLAILDIMYKEILDLQVKRENIERISKIIVAPPDSGIDLFIEIEDGDEYHYEIIQSKYAILTENEIRSCFSAMRRTIKDFIKNPANVQKNLSEVINSTNFGKVFESNCTYYVVHTGDVNYGKGFVKNEIIITLNHLLTLKNSVKDFKVAHEKFKSDAISNFIMYAHKKDDGEAMLCNLRGFDLAELDNDYSNSTIGRNILYGQNLRDSLEIKSKTNTDMKNTIDKEPGRFWYYNNGITIIAEKFDILKDKSDGSDYVDLKNFSIVNGAQTTSSLGKYLKEARLNQDEIAIENLKKVYVLARIIEVTDNDLSENIAIYNNSQNPITNRDMVSNRPEQRALNQKLFAGEKPNIYVEIRRGATVPPYPRTYKHQITTNEELAQLAFAAFMRSPYLAKSKKSKIFERENTQDGILLNESYNSIFSMNENPEKSGVLFQRSKFEIDEALFIKSLYRQSKSYLKKFYSNNIEKITNELTLCNEHERVVLNNRVNVFQRNKEINSICMFYCITYYYVIKSQFDKASGNISFNYKEFYESKNSEYRNGIIKDFAFNFLSPTISIIVDQTATGNASNWVRDSKSQDIFLNKLNNDMALTPKIEEEYKKFIESYKIKI